MSFHYKQKKEKTQRKIFTNQQHDLWWHLNLALSMYFDQHQSEACAGLNLIWNFLLMNSKYCANMIVLIYLLAWTPPYLLFVHGVYTTALSLNIQQSEISILNKTIWYKYKRNETKRKMLQKKRQIDTNNNEFYQLKCDANNLNTKERKKEMSMCCCVAHKPVQLTIAQKKSQVSIDKCNI